MPDMTLLSDGARIVGGVQSASEGAVVAAGSANTKGSWVELLSAANNPGGSWLMITVTHLGTTAASFLLDVGVGDASSEQVLVPNILMSKGTSAGCHAIALPLAVPPGVRISARIQSTLASNDPGVRLHVVSGGLRMSKGLGRATAYGATTADSGGISIDPGGTAHTWGAWTQIVASTTNPIKALMVEIGNQANASGSSGWFSAAVGVGGAGSEQMLIDNAANLRMSSLTDHFGPAIFGPYPVSVPAGTRLAVRARAASIDATDRLFDVVLRGLD